MSVPRTVTVLGAAVLLLAACTTATEQAASSTGGKGPLADKVADASQAHPGYAIPADPISGLDAVKGKTVYYIPITQQAPQFGVTQKALTAALGKAGVKVQTCNGNATPTDISACVSQATRARAGAIVTDAIPYALGANALDAAIAAGIPVLNTNQLPDETHPAAEKHGYITAPGSDQMVAVADWIINDSGGKAEVVINQSTDGPSAVAYVTAAKDEFAKECPDCKVTINPISSANFSLIPSSTSSALLKNPGVKYVVSEFDQYLQPTLGGVQQAGRLAGVKGLTGAAQLAGLQMLKNGNFLYAGVSQASAYQGWADADAVLRMMTGTSGADLPEHKIPIRLFTRETIGSVSLTDAAQASGEWFGPTDFPASYLKLWGLG
ncbi:sugar ABC transporter substrate-binding protein [Actinoplanes sp. RD1]|uniref:sugar ABC transporter substrate-binding protein n=1 Tax=Actinoplanes sp. RD1 TaxID=3064538 RepID=UPI0027412855|nr:substrate-binding domain-containing protein [Actinoplanes sp. RD1]